MSENKLNGLPENNSSELISKSEKIKAIKNSLESSYEKSAEWEAEMSQLISERVNRLENDKSDDVLSVIENTRNHKKPETENIPEFTEEPREELKEEPEEYKYEEETPELSNNNEIKKKKSFKERFFGLFPQKNDSGLEKCRKIIFMISVIAIVVCGSIVLDYYVDTTTTQHEYEEMMEGYSDESSSVTTQPVKDEETQKIVYSMMPSAEELYKINSDVVGVINIPDTDVFYPVVKGKDNSEYLNKTVTGEEARAGSIFIDYRNIFDEVDEDGVMQESSDNIIIYGHEMATGKMFGTLKLYKDNTYYYEEHPIIEFNSNYFCYKYKIFSIFIADANDKTDTRYEYWNALDFDDEEEFYDFVNEAKRRTIRLNDVDVKYGDKLITLSTCNEIFGKDAGGRLVVMARRLRDGEDPLEGTQNSSTNPNIKWPSIYYAYNGSEKYNEEDFVPYG